MFTNYSKKKEIVHQNPNKSPSARGELFFLPQSLRDTEGIQFAEWVSAALRESIHFAFSSRRRVRPQSAFKIQIDLNLYVTTASARVRVQCCTDKAHV